MNQQPWLPWAILEGSTKTSSALLQKAAGLAMRDGILATFFTLVIGVVQTASGFIGALHAIGKDGVQTLIPNRTAILWPLAFGFFSSLSTISGPLAFMDPNADLTGRTLLVLCSIIPGAIIGQVFFNEKLDGWQYMGIFVFLLAAWAILGFPVWKTTGAIPTWLLITLIPMFGNAINEGLAKAASNKLSIWANNFWIGLSTVFWSLVFMVIWLLVRDDPTNLEVSHVFVTTTLGVGVIVVSMVSFKLLAYRDDAWIALKKIVMNGSYLALAAVAGALFFEEAITWEKFLGIALFLVALVLSDRKIRSLIIPVSRTVK